METSSYCSSTGGHLLRFMQKPGHAESSTLPVHAPQKASHLWVWKLQNREPTPLAKARATRRPWSAARSRPLPDPCSKHAGRCWVGEVAILALQAQEMQHPASLWSAKPEKMLQVAAACLSFLPLQYTFGRSSLCCAACLWVHPCTCTQLLQTAPECLQRHVLHFQRLQKSLLQLLEGHLLALVVICHHLQHKTGTKCPQLIRNCWEGSDRCAQHSGSSTL